jgi:PAS domain S-box-containing protein
MIPEIEMLLTQNIHQLIQTLQNGIVVISAEDHKIVYVNDYAARLIGKTPAEIKGQVCHCFICPAEHGKCPVTDLGKEIDASRRELLRCGQNEKIPILKTVKPMTIGNHKYLVESFIDLTEYSQLEQRLRENNISEAVLEVVSGVAHHFNNFNSVLTCGLLMAKEVEDEGQPGYLLKKDYVDIMKTTMQKATSLIQKLVDFAQHRPLYLKNNKLFPLLEKASLAAKNNPEFSPERIEIALSGDRDAVAEIDPIRLEEALTNLAHNAVEAIPHGKPGKISFDISSHTTAESTPLLEKGRYWKISITDNGSGILEENKKHLLTPFFTTKDPKRSGMGLKIADRIIKRNHGVMQIESVPDHGATVNIYFKACD